MSRFATSLVILCILWRVEVNGQLIQELAFSETTYDFGTVKEVDGPVEHEFVFTNSGSNPVKIENVKASCGCTTPGWTEEEVAPGEKGFVKARYDPTNRPGPFRKSLAITTNGDQKNYVLFIEGQVEPKPRTIEDDFPQVMGALRVKNRAFNMGKIYNHTATTREFEVYNQSDGPVTFLAETKHPDYISVEIIPLVLASKEKGAIMVSYDAKARNDLGFMSDNVTLTTDEIEESVKSFSVYANIEEYFPPLTEEGKASAPRLVIEKSMFDFGKIQKDALVSTVFLLKNEGKSNLNIRKTSTTCGCTVSKLSSEDIAPGEVVEMEVTFNSLGRRGTQQKSVTIYSSDPLTPTQRVTIKAVVLEQ